MHPMLAAQKTPDKPAIIMAATGETVTFQELEDRSNQAAQLFRDAENATDKPVVCGCNEIETG